MSQATLTLPDDHINNSFVSCAENAILQISRAITHAVQCPMQYSCYSMTRAVCWCSGCDALAQPVHCVGDPVVDARLAALGASETGRHQSDHHPTAVHQHHQGTAGVALKTGSISFKLGVKCDLEQ